MPHRRLCIKRETPNFIRTNKNKQDIIYRVCVCNLYIVHFRVSRRISNRGILVRLYFRGRRAFAVCFCQRTNFKIWMWKSVFEFDTWK